MSSIPFDPTLNLGQIVSLSKIDDLMEIAEIQKRVDAALDKMNNLIRMSYSLGMVKSEMTNMNAGFDKIMKLNEKILDVKHASVDAAIAYADTVVECEDLIQEANERHSKKNYSWESPESPMDYGMSKVTSFPLGFESLKFDVQYVRNESNEDSTYSHASAVEASASASVSHITYGAASMSTSTSANSSLHEQTSKHNIEGTIVLTAYATHKQAAVIDPFVLDPEKAVGSWNQMYPEDAIQVFPETIIAAALGGMDSSTSVDEQNTLNIITGCAKASSFVGFVHILQEESTKSSQSSSSMATAMKATVEKDMFVASQRGSFGTSMSVSNMCKSLTSTSKIDNHANLSCMGCIPSIVSNDVVSTVQTLKPDPQEVAESLATISESSSGAVNRNMEAAAGDVKMAGQAVGQDSSYVSAAVSAMGEIANENNKVIDVNSMLTAFEDFINKAMGNNATEGEEGGVPINFMIKKITKSDVAKCYIRRFYPNGASDPNSANRGMMGQEPKEEE
eukprot:CAMPEP_0194173938 /NCGR_PEP_ID=MMETSP0154-20130528/8200_1 /TAXON_ID=1049557 /ORGANISM="Thalassiothrix antarctica, Strain L6-D1" /LENGTH=506 /DNA_ID=CAMNT_0038887191 /DNA_START=44 /DNA_END=1564 /DNA_ORIENTATION=+